MTNIIKKTSLDRLCFLLRLLISMQRLIFFSLSTERERLLCIQRSSSKRIQSNFILLHRWRDKESVQKKIPFNREKESKSKRATVQTYRADMIMFITAIARSLLIPIWSERERLTRVNRGHEGVSTMYRRKERERKKKLLLYLCLTSAWDRRTKRKKFSFIVEHTSCHLKEKEKATRATVVQLTSHCKQVVSPHHLH